MDIKQLKVFCAVVERGSFSKAGGVLGLTQPTVSFQVGSLEEELGTRLFDRGVKEVTLTKSGEVLYRYARRISELTAEAKRAVDQLKGLVIGELTIAASNRRHVRADTQSRSVRKSLLRFWRTRSPTTST